MTTELIIIISLYYRPQLDIICLSLGPIFSFLHYVRYSLPVLFGIKYIVQQDPTPDPTSETSTLPPKPLDPDIEPEPLASQPGTPVSKLDKMIKVTGTFRDLATNRDMTQQNAPQTCG